MTTLVSPPQPLTLPQLHQRQALPAPVLAVVGEQCPLNPAVIKQAAQLAQQLQAPLQMIYVYFPMGFTTDVALINSKVQRRQLEFAGLLAQLVRLLPIDHHLGAHLAPASWLPWRDRAGRTWRTIARTARLRAAQLIVAPVAMVPLPERVVANNQEPRLVVVTEPTAASISSW